MEFTLKRISKHNVNRYVYFVYSTSQAQFNVDFSNYNLYFASSCLAFDISGINRPEIFIFMYLKYNDQNLYFFVK